MSRAAVLALAFAGGCGDSSGDETGNDTQTASASATMTTTVGEGTGSESSSASQTAGTTNTTSTTATSTAGDSSSSSSAEATATESSSGGSSSGGSSTGDSGQACAMQQESCANGELCCDGLMCCAGVPVPPGAEYCGMECPDSDRNLKEGFAPVDADAVLAKLATLPVTSWSYKSEGSEVRHIGPMAQDFKAAFQVGGSERAIAKVDADGVAFAAIQGLLHRVRDLERENTELRERLAKIERALANDHAEN